VRLTSLVQIRVGRPRWYPMYCWMQSRLVQPREPFLGPAKAAFSLEAAVSRSPTCRHRGRAASGQKPSHPATASESIEGTWLPSACVSKPVPGTIADTRIIDEVRSQWSDDQTCNG